MSKDHKPCVFVFEGADGTGKAHHAKSSTEVLAGRGLPVRAFHHKGPPKEIRHDPVDSARWFTLERMRLLDTLRPGELVIADRWFWSTPCVEATLDPESAAAREMRRMADWEAAFWGFSEPGVVNSPACDVRILLCVLDAPDHVLDARLEKRGEPLPDDRHAMRGYYRGLSAELAQITPRPWRLQSSYSTHHPEYPETEVAGSALRYAIRYAYNAFLSGAL